jgi:DNA modification methylase
MTPTTPGLPATQLRLALEGLEDAADLEALPTFADCRRAAVHRWYPIVVGFSRTSVSSAIAEAQLAPDDLVLDPFVGCGTTCVVAKAMGVRSIGVEAHPFLALASRVKTTWDLLSVASGDVRRLGKDIVAEARRRYRRAEFPQAPAFVRKLFPDDEVLAKLYGLRDTINERLSEVPPGREFMTLALVRAAHDSTPSKIDGVYIAPTTHKSTCGSPFESFTERLAMMESDLQLVRRWCADAPADIIEGDARNMSGIPANSIGLVFTSPPYLNNFDYAEMTRLELYLLGMARSWREISKRVRAKLVVNATTQVTRTQAKLCTPDPALPEDVRASLARMSGELADLRLGKGGRKDYDITVVAYFNDMLRVLREIHRVLRPGGACRLIVGDSALYGVHVPTDELLCSIAENTGFGRAAARVLRHRGHRWRLPRRTYVPLRESEITLWK